MSRQYHNEHDKAHVDMAHEFMSSKGISQHAELPGMGPSQFGGSGGPLAPGVMGIEPSGPGPGSLAPPEAPPTFATHQSKVGHRGYGPHGKGKK